MDDRVLSQSEQTKLVTSLSYLGAGPEAIADLQQRVDEINETDQRIIVGEVTTDAEGRPVCGISFECGSYDPPKINDFGEVEPDPKALEDLRGVLKGINLDDCLFWSPITILTEEPARV
jgi:hypothetical protein